jgi:hypothetical protein
MSHVIKWSNAYGWLVISAIGAVAIAAVQVDTYSEALDVCARLHGVV